ncbi:IS3 family transposase [Nocardioides korecus]
MWRTRDLLRSASFDYVEGFYNTSRIKAPLGYRSPAQFKQESIAQDSVSTRPGQVHTPARAPWVATASRSGPTTGYRTTSRPWTRCTPGTGWTAATSPDARTCCGAP